MSPRVKQSTSQKQYQDNTLKSEMIRSLKVLSLPSLELEAYLLQELETNPMLEMADPFNDDDDVDQIEQTDNTIENTESEDNDDFELKKTLEDAKELSDELDAWNETYGDNMISADTISESDEDNNYENLAATPTNLKLDFIDKFDKYHLLESEYFFIYDLIDNANNHGFLPIQFDIYTLAAEYNLTKERADELHILILKTDPRGITARSINESLFYQLEDYEQNDSILAGIILENFDDLLHSRNNLIANKYEIDEDEVLLYRKRIALLDPKPGLRINTGNPEFIVPDVIITKIDDEYEVIVNDFYIPKISINKSYQKIIHEANRDRETLDYIKKKINSAMFLIKAVYTRNKTLEKITKCIITNQKKFFYHESKQLDPLTYSMVANELDINESTVSRVVKIKYADTPFGIFCLKDFFVANAGKEKGFEAVSRLSVHEQIKNIIDNEDSRSPISDQEIVNIFKERGINLSRRVITKYREELKIPNSRERRR